MHEAQNLQHRRGSIRFFSASMRPVRKRILFSFIHESKVIYLFSTAGTAIFAPFAADAPKLKRGTKSKA